MWALLYDSGGHAFWFYPFKGSAAPRSRPARTACPRTRGCRSRCSTRRRPAAARSSHQRADAGGWGVSGNYTRSTNLQRLQLWNDAADTTDFDDVSIATPATTRQRCRARRRRHRHGRQRLGGTDLDGAGLRRRQPDHRLPDHAVHRHDRADGDRHRDHGRRRAPSPASRTAPRTRSRWRRSTPSAPGPTRRRHRRSRPSPPRRCRARRPASRAPRATARWRSRWTAPASNGGSPITSYRVTPYIGTTAQTAINTGSTATSFTVTGLTNGTAYTFTVAAINAVGTGAESAASRRRSRPARRCRVRRRRVAGTAGNGSVALDVDGAGLERRQRDHGYRVTPYIGTTAQTAIIDRVDRDELHGHRPDERHRVHVHGRRDQRASAPARTRPRRPRSRPRTVPGAPTGGRRHGGQGQVALTWTAPASNGGSAITGYRVTPFIGTTAQTAMLTGSTATTSFTVTGLTNGTAYTFTVAAINAVGTGADSAASAAVTPSRRLRRRRS